MRDELARNMSSLKLDTIPPAYFIAYRIDDQHALTVSGSFGGVISTRAGTSRIFRVGLRVGTPSFDNTNFFSFGEGSGLRFSYGASGTSLDDNYDAIRRDLWLSTDAAYKSALQDLSKKQAAFEHKTRSDDTIDFSPAAPFHNYVTPHVIAFDTAKWQMLVRSLSGVFASYKNIQACNATVSMTNGETYYLTSEGTEIAEPGNIIRVEVSATTQSPDGMPLSDALQWVELEPQYLPSQKIMMEAVSEMAARLDKMRTAPVLEEYTGPVLVEGEASAEIFTQVFDDAFCAIRRPDVDNPQMKMALGMLAKESPFQSRIGSRIFPEGYTVDDLTTRETIGGVHCVGTQLDDDEGVPSKDIRLVDHGVIKTLLTCRTPHKRFAISNGRAFSMPARPAITNLVFATTQGVSDAELKSKLIEQCKARELPYGLKITRMSPSTVRSGDQQDMMMLMMSRMGGDGDGQKVSRPTAVYKVYPDGREELVRGAELAGIGMSAFKEILASGKSQTVYNTFVDVKGQESPYQGSSTKSVTIVVPNVLFDELSAKKISGPFKTLPVVDAP